MKVDAKDLPNLSRDSRPQFRPTAISFAKPHFIAGSLVQIRTRFRTSVIVCNRNGKVCLMRELSKACLSLSKRGYFRLDSWIPLLFFSFS